MGKLHVDQQNEKGCDAYSLVDKNEIERSADVTPFYLARRGGDCSFVQKVRNMQNIGVAVGVIIDDIAENTDRIQMSDDGTGGGISIPSMLISKVDGEKLLKWMKNSSKAELSKVVVMAEFDLAQNVDNKVDYEFWMTSSSNRALDFIEDFQQFHEMLLREGDEVSFTPRYVFWECVGCDKRYLDNDCYGGGAYCAIEPSNDAIKGREIILEDLRQMCLFSNLQETKRNVTQWFKYIKRAHATCYGTINEDCSRQAH